MGWSVVLFGCIPKSNFWHDFDVFFFGLSHFALFQCNFYRYLCGKELNLHLFCVISMFVSGRCLYKRFKCFKNFNEFSMYLFWWRKGEGGGGCTNACICMGTQSAFTTEPLNGCLRNLVGMKCSWPCTCIKMFRPYPPSGGSRVKQK